MAKFQKKFFSVKAMKFPAMELYFGCSKTFGKISLKLSVRIGRYLCLKIECDSPLGGSFVIMQLFLKPFFFFC